ncbi:MAG: hypothetical protein Q9160_001496 [Pyrenula sp. 1 TL-2023]
MASSLGNLSQLPPELRNKIYHESSYRTKLALIKTSSTLRHEAQGFLLDKFPLSLHFTRSFHNHSASFITVLDDTGDVICRLPHASVRDNLDVDFWSFPFHRVTALNLVLDAQGPEKAGEDYYLYNMGCHLMAALAERRGWQCVPPIVVMLSDEKCGSGGSKIARPLERRFFSRLDGI